MVEASRIKEEKKFGSLIRKLIQKSYLLSTEVSDKQFLSIFKRLPLGFLKPKEKKAWSFCVGKTDEQNTKRPSPCVPDSMKLRIIHDLCQGLGISLAEFFASPLFDEDNLEP